MVKFHNTTHTLPHPFETVSLAYYLRYPNPYSTHVISTDTLSRHYDPDTHTLHTARLHLKRSSIPPTILKLLPRSLLSRGAVGGDGVSQSYILERTVVDVDTGVMVTESRNLEFTGVLAVAERQVYQRGGRSTGSANWREFSRRSPRREQTVRDPLFRDLGQATRIAPSPNTPTGDTAVSTQVELQSRLGQVRERLARPRAPTSDGPDAVEASGAKVGFFRSLGASSIQRTIETVALRRAERSQPNSKAGMNVVLERLRRGGVVAVLEGMKRDRKLVVGAE